MLNSNKLKAKIVESGLSIAKTAELLDINVSTLYRKISSGYILIGEAAQLCAVLNLNADEATEIFFATQVA